VIDTTRVCPVWTTAARRLWSGGHTVTSESGRRRRRLSAAG